MDRKGKPNEDEVKKNDAYPTDAKQPLRPYFCDRCKIEIPLAEKAEHDDWHFAIELQGDEESHANRGTAAPSSNSGLPTYAQPSFPSNEQARAHRHINCVVEASMMRARDEQEMQNALQSLQLRYKIYNSEIEPEHEANYLCSCPIHQYQSMKVRRSGVQDMWSRAVIYPGEKAYNDNYMNVGLFSGNPYRYQVISPYQGFQFGLIQRPQPLAHSTFIHQTIQLNNRLNKEAQARIDAQEPDFNIWDSDVLDARMSQLSLKASDQKRATSSAELKSIERGHKETGEGESEKLHGNKTQHGSTSGQPHKSSKLSSFKRSLGMKSAEEKAAKKMGEMVVQAEAMRNEILAEELSRWPDHQWRSIVTAYQDKVGMTRKISHFRAHRPIQYLHLLRAGYFEPIPVAWANQNSNPLKFSIEAASGWRGITPAWRGYEDTAEERLYWVLNHREGSTGMRMKPDLISALDMALARMATAVEPPPQYFSTNDTCHVQHTSEGYSKQVMPPPFRGHDRPELPTDDTMILLDVSGSMGFEPVRPNYNRYLITGYSRSTQPKNKDVAKAIIRRFTDAMSNHDHSFNGYDLVTFANHASYIGKVDHRNFDALWKSISVGGGTRVMTGWQQVKELHFRKHSASATHHPVYGWQAGPETPILRLLLLLDGEATDMDEFELDVLGLSWAHVTIFLIGVDGCPHHHRHANELQRISDNNHNVSFVDAQGNMPERFVTHELLKRHLGYDVSMAEFEQMEELPPYSET